jgi:WhiB family transcriptional regulator, redox-sensing transcriptional regulator
MELTANSVNWREVAACRDADPDLFFPVGTARSALRQIEEAKRICRVCPARTQCLAWALDHEVDSGVWGGTTEDERSTIRRPVQKNRPSARTTMPVNDRARESEAYVRRQLRRKQPRFAAALESAVTLAERELKSPAGDLQWIQAAAACIRMACEQMTAPPLEMLRDSVECAASLPARSGWESKAAAHAEIFRLLAEIIGEPVAGNPGDGAGFIRELMRAVGPGANGMVIGSRRRLLEHLCAGDADAAEHEMKTHLRALHFMWRLTQASRAS